MNDIPDLNPPPPNDSPADVIPVAEPMLPEPHDVLPVPPPPGLGMAAVWIGVFLAAQVALGLTIGVFSRMINEQPPMLWLHVCAIALNLVVSFLIVASVLGKETWSSLALRRFRPVHLGAVLALALPLAMTALLAAGIATASFQLILRILLPSPTADDVIKWVLRDHKELEQSVRENLWLMIVFGGFVTGVAEEVFFRGFIGRGLLARYGLVLGIMLTSALFGIAHLNPIQGCATFIMGLGFHIIFLTSRSLWLSVLAHALHNSTLLTLVIYPEVQQALFSPLVMSLGPPVTALVLWFLYATRTEWRMPDGRIWSPGYPTAEMPPPQIGAMAVKRSPSGVMLLTAVVCLLFYVNVALSLSGAFGK